VNKASSKILVVVALILALRPALKLYAVQEILIILLAVAVTAMVLLLSVLALLLFWEGARLVFIWLTPTIGQTARGDGSAWSRGQVIHSLLRRR
jgi:endonuclease/exonuclease/phosphatase (EEP) superfamily protein YafD